MIQRIQTLYWLLWIACLVVMQFLPFATVSLAEGDIALGAWSMQMEGAPLMGMWPFGALLSLITVLLFWAIVSYLNRTRQIRITLLALLLTLGVIGLEAFYSLQTVRISGGLWSASWVLYLPLLSLFCGVMALRGVRRDAAIVASIDRLR